MNEIFNYDFDYKMCPHYSEDHDMGKTIPLCGEKPDYCICDGCKSDMINALHGKPPLKPEDAILLLLLMAMAPIKKDDEEEKHDTV